MPIEMPQDAMLLLGTIDGKVDSLTDLVKTEIDDRKALEARVLETELSRARERGYTAGISAAVAAFITYCLPSLRSVLHI